MNQQEWTTHIGRALRSARLAGGMSQAEVARHIGLSRTSLLNIEQGRQQISAFKLHRLNEFLNAGLDQKERADANAEFAECKALTTLNAMRRLLLAHDDAAGEHRED